MTEARIGSETMNDIIANIPDKDFARRALMLNAGAAFSVVIIIAFSSGIFLASGAGAGSASSLAPFSSGIVTVVTASGARAGAGLLAVSAMPVKSGLSAKDTLFLKNSLSHLIAKSSSFKRNFGTDEKYLGESLGFIVTCIQNEF